MRGRRSEVRHSEQGFKVQTPDPETKYFEISTILVAIAHARTNEYTDRTLCWLEFSLRRVLEYCIPTKLDLDRKLQVSKAPLESQALGNRLFTSAASRRFSKGYTLFERRLLSPVCG